MEFPTVFVGTTQSGKTWRAFRTFELHQGPAIFWDVQWRAGHYSPKSARVPTVAAAVELLTRWQPAEGHPRIVIEDERYTDLDTLVAYLWSVHRRAHVEGRPFPSVALYLDEVSLAADRYADMENPACRLFTQLYQHGIVGVAITQRPAQTSRNLLGNAWEWYTFSPGRGDMEVYEQYDVVPPDETWLRSPADHQYYRWTSDGRCFRGDEEGVEVDVTSAVPEVQEGEAEGPVSPGAGDEPAGGAGPVVDKPAGGEVSRVPHDLSHPGDESR